MKRNKDVACTAFSGYAALSYEGGTTFHSYFGIIPKVGCAACGHHNELI